METLVRPRAPAWQFSKLHVLRTLPPMAGPLEASIAYASQGTGFLEARRRPSDRRSLKGVSQAHATRIGVWGAWVPQ